MVFVGLFVNWFNVRMAVLAPLVACLCYGHSYRDVMKNSVRNFMGVGLGGFLCILWLLILRSCARSITGGDSYNQYIAMVAALPWLAVFHLFSPRSLISVPALSLIFTTLTMYCGDNDAPDASPLRAISAGCLGALASGGVGYFVHFVLFDRARTTPAFSIAETKLWAFWDALLEELIACGGEVDRTRSECLEALGGSYIPRSIQEALTDCFSSLSAMHAVVRSTVRSSPLPGELCTSILELKSSRLRQTGSLSQSADRLCALAHSLAESGTRSVASLRVLAVTDVLKSFLGSIDRLRLVSLKSDSGISLNRYLTSIKFPRFSWLGLCQAVRFSVVLVGLCELLIFWDANDDTVDTYALWALIPALLFADRVQYVGQAIMDGASYTLSALLGSGIGALCLLLNSGDRTSYLAEYLLVIIFGLWIQKKSDTDVGTIFILSWIICVLGNLGLDPTETESHGLNILWRVALYRMAITCFSVFVMALSFVVLPTRFASKTFEHLTINVIADALGVVGSDLKNALESVAGVTTVMRFSLKEYGRGRRFAKTECVRRRHPLMAERDLIDFAAAIAALSAVQRLSLVDINSDDKAVTLLKEGISGVIGELERFSTESGIREAQLSMVKPRARHLSESISFSKRRFCSNVDMPPGFSAVYLEAVVVADLVKRWLPIESHLDLHEEVPSVLDQSHCEEDDAFV